MGRISTAAFVVGIDHGLPTLSMASGVVGNNAASRARTIGAGGRFPRVIGRLPEHHQERGRPEAVLVGWSRTWTAAVPCGYWMTPWSIRSVAGWRAENEREDRPVGWRPGA